VSRSPVPYQSKLLLLKSVPSRPIKIGFFASSNRNLPVFFGGIVTAMVVVILTIQFFASVQTSRKLLQAQQKSLLSNIELLLTTDLSQREKLFQVLETQMLEVLNPVLVFGGGTVLVQNDIQRIKTLANEWVDTLQPLYGFTFNGEGFTHKTDATKSFTKTLEAVFDSLPQLKTATNQLWGDFWLYRVFASISGNSNFLQAFNTIENLISSLDLLYELKTTLLELLGHFSTQRIVLFNQNVGEARPTGGFIGSYIPLDISQGKITMGQSQSIYFVDGARTQPVVSHPSTWYLDAITGTAYPHGIRNLNMFSCFPVTANLLEREFAESKNGYSIDQVVMITPQLIERLLPSSFAITIGTNVGIHKANFIQEIERLTSIETANTPNPKSLLSTIFKDLLSSMQSIIAQDGVISILRRFITSFQTRDVQLWFRNSEAQKRLESFGFAADQTCTNDTAHIISPVFINLSGDKRGLVSENTLSLRTHKTLGGTRVIATINQYLPEQKDLQRTFQEVSLSMFGLQIPKNSFDHAVYSDRSMNIPYLRVDYTEKAQQGNTKQLEVPQEISTTVNSGIDLPAGGFVYDQPDGSQVLGAYINDTSVGDTTVNFEFTLPLSSGDMVEYYGQPGLRNPQLALGDGVTVLGNSPQKIISNPAILQSGVALKID
jgi:uncharacterized membrane protein